MDRLTKTAHFILLKTGFTMEKLAQMYVEEIVRLHGLPFMIISDKETHFVNPFWKSLHEVLGTKLHFSAMLHP